MRDTARSLGVHWLHEGSSRWSALDGESLGFQGSGISLGDLTLGAQEP